MITDKQLRNAQTLRDRVSKHTTEILGERSGEEYTTDIITAALLIVDALANLEDPTLEDEDERE